MIPIRHDSSSAGVIARAALCLLAVVVACDGGRGDVAVELERSTVAASDASNPSVAIAPNGGALVAWVGGSDGEDVWLARGDSGAFADAMRVNDQPGDAAAHAQAPAQVAVGPDGDVYVLWQNNTPIEGRRFPASDLRFARSGDGGRSFEPTIYVNDDAGGAPTSHSFHDLEVGPDGTVYASWIDGRREAEAGPDIRVARSTDGGRSFAPSSVVARAACPCCRTNLAVAPDGTVYVAWRHVFDGSVRDIALARSTDGGVTFGAPVRVHADDWVYDGCPHAGPGVAVDRGGTVHVAWYTGAEGTSGVYHASSRDGGRTFAVPRPLTDGGHVPTSQVALSASGDGTAWLAWETMHDEGVSIRLARIDEDGAIRIADIDSPRGLLPSLAARGDALALAWLDGESTRALVGRGAWR